MKILAEIGRNKHRQKIVRVECTCGRIFEAIYNNVKRGRTTTCGHCGEPQSIPEQKIISEIMSTFERDTPAWFDEKIASAIAAAETSEEHVQVLQAQIAASESTDLDLIKRWTAESKIARQLRQDIARFRTQKSNAETATVKTNKTQAEITREKIAALRGDK